MANKTFFSETQDIHNYEWMILTDRNEDLTNCDVLVFKHIQKRVCKKRFNATKLRNCKSQSNSNSENKIISEKPRLSMFAFLFFSLPNFLQMLNITRERLIPNSLIHWEYFNQSTQLASCSRETYTKLINTFPLQRNVVQFQLKFAHDLLATMQFIKFLCSLGIFQFDQQPT